MNIDFESMDDEMKKLYSVLWEDNEFIVNSANHIEKSIDRRYKVPSRNSYCFSGKEEPKELLTKLFGFSTTSNFGAGSEFPILYAWISIRKKLMLSLVLLFSHSIAAR